MKSIVFSELTKKLRVRETQLKIFTLMNAVKVGIPWNECLRNIVAVCYYHLTYVFHCESTLYSCLNVKDVIAQNRCNIYNLSDSNGIRTHSHWARKRTLKNLAKLSKWLCVILQTKWSWVRISFLPLRWHCFKLSY